MLLEGEPEALLEMVSPATDVSAPPLVDTLSSFSRLENN